MDLPGDRLLQRSVEWSKQNLADSVQEARGLDVFASREGTRFPPLAGTVDVARWVGAGWPDYPWIFATDAEYTAFASVAAGQFEPIKAHLRALRDISEIVNGGSGKVVHEVTPDGQVYFGANDDPGNTDESAKFPSTVALIWRWTGDDAFRDEMYDAAVRAMRYVTALDADADGWPEGLGNVERPGMGGEKLDVAVYTVRGLRDLADLAASRGDRAVAGWASAQAGRRERAFERTWWYGGDAAAYADSLSDPGDVAVFQRHWTGLTPMEAELPGGPLAAPGNARLALAQRERDCYTGEFGLFHTGSGPTSAPAGNTGPSCDSVVSAVPSRAGDVLAQHRGGGRRRGQLRPARAATPLHHRQRPHPARPGRLGDARRDAGGGAVAGLRRQHRAGLPGPVQRAASLGRVRRALAGGAPAARRRSGRGPRPAVGGAGAAARPRAHRRARHPARHRIARRDGDPDRARAHRLGARGAAGRTHPRRGAAVRRHRRGGYAWTGGPRRTGNGPPHAAARSCSPPAPADGTRWRCGCADRAPRSGDRDPGRFLG
nr:hypothetical protein GCM10020092_081670 [Actinoplanes digitatis]